MFLIKSAMGADLLSCNIFLCVQRLVILPILCQFYLIFAFNFLVQMRRNMAKLDLYRKFTNTLAVSVLLSIAWIGFEVVFFLLFSFCFYFFWGEGWIQSCHVISYIGMLGIFFLA